MSSLTSHLRETGDHGRLRFHRDCPVCRSERLAGTLPDPAVVSPCLGATLVATALAASASAPTTTALAGGPPAIRQSAEPRPPAGAQDGRPVTAGDGRPVTADDSGGDREPGAARPDRDDGHGGRGETSPPEPATPASPAAPSEPAPEEPDHDAAPSRPAHPASTSPEPAAPEPPAERATTPSRAEASARSAPAEPTPERGKRSSATPPGASSAKSARGPSERERRAVDSKRRQQRGQAVHVVERGECLWTIAEERLGRDASDAAVAREVTQMWRLNERRMRSGDPDLIFPGERLGVPRG